MLWTPRNREGRWVECVKRLVPISVQVEIVSDGALIYSRIFPPVNETLAWAEKERVQRQSCDREPGHTQHSGSLWRPASEQCRHSRQPVFRLIGVTDLSLNALGHLAGVDSRT